MRPRLYVLDEHGEPQAMAGPRDILAWAHSFEIEERRVAREQVGLSTVSTVFLGVDHSHTHGGPPILWETMVFDGRLNGSCTRCSGSREQALAMHQRMVKLVQEAL